MQPGRLVDADVPAKPASKSRDRGRVVLPLPSRSCASVDLAKADSSPPSSRHPRDGHGHELEAPRAIQEPSLAPLGATARARGPRLPEHVGGVTRASRQERGSRQLHGRDYRRDFGSGTPESRARQFLGQSSRCSRASTKAWNGKSAVDFWPGYLDERLLLVLEGGAVPRFSGMEARREGNCHFAGEHTSIDFQGYLNGAVDTGQRAAAEIFADLK